MTESLIYSIIFWCVVINIMGIIVETIKISVRKLISTLYGIVSFKNGTTNKTISANIIQKSANNNDFKE